MSRLPDSVRAFVACGELLEALCDADGACSRFPWPTRSIIASWRFWEGRARPTVWVSAPYDHESRYFAKDVLALDRCAYCSAPVDCIDHVEPKAGGGPDHWSNFTGACRFCNGSKGASPLLQFLLRKTARQGIWDFVPPGQATR